MSITPTARRDTCSDAKEKPNPNLLQGESAHHNLLKHCENELLPIGDGERACNLLLFYRQRRTFFTAKGRFLNRGGCCRHAKHGVGDVGDTEENLFSDWRHRQPQKGETDNSRHGFLYLHHPLIEAADNGLVQRQSLCFLLRVTPSAKHNIHCDAPPYYIYCCRPQLELLPLGRLRWGFLCIMLSPFLFGNIVTRSRIFICIYTIF